MTKFIEDTFFLPTPFSNLEIQPIAGKCFSWLNQKIETTFACLNKNKMPFLQKDRNTHILTQ